jgi:hypothetical protein
MISRRSQGDEEQERADFIGAWNKRVDLRTIEAARETPVCNPDTCSWDTASIGHASAFVRNNWRNSGQINGC